MGVRLVWSPRAREDLLEIYVLIGLDQPNVAERYFDRIETIANLLADQPRLGARRPDIAPSVRMLVEHPYLILYETVPDIDIGPVERVEIVRIVDGRRELSNLF